MELADSTIRAKRGGTLDTRPLGWWDVVVNAGKRLTSLSATTIMTTRRLKMHTRLRPNSMISRTSPFRSGMIHSRPTLLTLFLAGNGGVLACVPVPAEDDLTVGGPFDESCSSCCVSSFRSSDLTQILVFPWVTRRFRPFPSGVRWCSLSSS